MELVIISAAIIIAVAVRVGLRDVADAIYYHADVCSVSEDELEP